ncbi:MAG: hypothetical protein AB8I08_14385 [Sandaracinaceae bacterium]
MQNIGRFLQPPRLLVTAVLSLFAALFGVGSVYSFVYESTLRLGSIALGLLFFVAALASFAWVFPRGCKRCRVLLDDHFGAYPPAMFDTVAAAVANPHPQTSAGLGPHRLQQGGSHRTLVTVEVCPRCRAVGAARVIEQTYRQNYWHINRDAPEVLVDAANVDALLGLTG